MMDNCEYSNEMVKNDGNSCFPFTGNFSWSFVRNN